MSRAVRWATRGAVGKARASVGSVAAALQGAGSGRGQRAVPGGGERLLWAMAAAGDPGQQRAEEVAAVVVVGSCMTDLVRLVRL